LAGHVARMGDEKCIDFGRKMKITGGRNRRLILEWIFDREVGWEILDLVHVALDIEQFRTLVRAVMNLRFT